MAFVPSTPELGLQAIGLNSTVQNSALGRTITAYDPTFGEGEFIYLVGVANTVVGSAVIYDATTFQTTLAPSTANLARPIAWAMGASVASQYGWYQMSGAVTALKSVNHNIQPNVAVGVLSAGKIATTSSSGAGKEIEGARYTGAATAASASTTCVIVVNRPHYQGRIT